MSRSLIRRFMLLIAAVPRRGRPAVAAVSPSFTRLRHLRLEILLAIHANQLEEITQREWADEQAQQSEVADAADRADQGDQRMNRGEAAIDQRPDEVVDAPHDEHTPNDQQSEEHTSELQ